MDMEVVSICRKDEAPQVYMMPWKDQLREFAGAGTWGCSAEH